MPLGEAAAGREPFALFRVDDRLLHGQVALAWGRHLDPKHYLLADDTLAADPETSELYLLSAPEGCTVAVLSLEETIHPKSPMPSPRRTVLLVRDLETTARLLRGGVPGPVNLGGIHFHPQARQILPYLFLNPEEEAILAELAREGHSIFAQDLPQNPRWEPARWSRADAGAASGE